MADQPKDERCENCKFYQMAALRKNLEGQITYQNTQMVCKRYPTSATERGHHTTEGFANRAPYQWCGEWRPAEPATIEAVALEIAHSLIKGDLSGARAMVDKAIEILNEGCDGR